MTMNHHDLRRLSWDGCPNARDLGGLPTTGGARTRWGTIIRSDSPNRLTPVGEQALIDHGIRTIVDLRLPDEAIEFAHPFARPGPHGIVYVNVSFIDPNEGAPVAAPISLADEYKRMLGVFSQRVGAIMRAIAGAADGGVLIHCAAGKDRTGLTCALLLDLVGVPRQIIAEDYALSLECMREQTEAWIASEPAKRAERELEAERWNPLPRVMLDAFAFIDESYGGTEAYLVSAGVRQSEIARLRERLISPGLR